MTDIPVAHPETFPDGTVLGAHLAQNVPSERIGGPPPASAPEAQATVSSGSATLSGLDSDVAYWVVGQVNGGFRWLRVIAGTTPTVALAEIAAALEAHIADQTDVHGATGLLVDQGDVNFPTGVPPGGLTNATAELQARVASAALIGGGIIDGYGRTYGIAWDPGLLLDDNVQLWNMTLTPFGPYPFGDTNARIVKNADDAGNEGLALRKVIFDGGGMKSWITSGSITSGQATLTAADVTDAEVGMAIVVEGAGPLVATTTGSIDKGEYTLTVASAAGIVVGNDVVVVGAGAGGVDLISRVIAITGTKLTLRKKCGTTVSSVAVTAREDTFTILSIAPNSPGPDGVVTLDGNASATVASAVTYMDQSDNLKATACVLKGCDDAYADIEIRRMPGGGYHFSNCLNTRTIITTREVQRGPFIPKGDCSGLIAWLDIIQPPGGDDCVNITSTGSVAGADAAFTDGFTLFGRCWQGDHLVSGGNEGIKFTGCRNGTAWLDTSGGTTASVVVQDGGDAEDIFCENVVVHATSRDCEGNAFNVSSAGCSGIVLKGDAIRPGGAGALIEVLGDGTIGVDTELYVEAAGQVDTALGALRFRDQGTTGTINGHHKLRVNDSAGGFVQMKGTPSGKLTFDIAGTDPNSAGNGSEDAISIDGPDVRITNLWIRRTGSNKPRNALRLVSGTLSMPQGALDAAPGDFSGNLTSGTFTPTVASAATVAVPSSARSVTISGTADITSITATYDGHIVSLVFTGTAATNGVVDGSNLKLGSNFPYTPDDTLTLLCDGSAWRELERSVN